jgi:GT2 family glycosyltransferase
MVLDGIRDNISDATSELIVVLDGCTDNSASIVKGYNQFRKMVITSTDDVWEVKANNVGLKLSTQPYCMIIQDDMVVQEKDFDKKLLTPFLAYKDVFAVSARTTHDNTIIDNQLHHIHPVGKESNLAKGIFVIRDSCNRGPLLLEHAALDNLGYLDEQFAPLHLDDHDICMRAYKQLRMVSGAYMIDYRSDHEWGSSHRPEVAKISNDAWHKNAEIMKTRHYDALMGVKHGEKRICPLKTQASDTSLPA